MGTKTTFDVPGTHKFNTEIFMISHITLVHWIAERRLNSQELIGYGDAYRREWLKLKEILVAGLQFHGMPIMLGVRVSE